MTYKNILVAVDLSDESNQVLDRASALANTQGNIHLIHVLEPLALAYGADALININEVQDQLDAQAREKISALAHKHNIPISACQILLGNAATELHEFAEKECIDLIITGSHGRSGLALLLGSTANALLHGAQCDVLAVKIKPSTLD